VYARDAAITAEQRPMRPMASQGAAQGARRSRGSRRSRGRRGRPCGHRPVAGTSLSSSKAKAAKGSSMPQKKTSCAHENVTVTAAC